MNKIYILGRLGKDVETKYMPDGKAISNFAVATSDKYTSKTGELVEKTEWHRIVCFGKTAEIAKDYLRKGSQVFVDGKLQTRSYDNKLGNTVYITEIIAERINFFEGKQTSKGPAKAENALADYEKMKQIPFTEDDIPL